MVSWITASILQSPGFFSVFWLILTMLLFGWSPLSSFFQILQSVYLSFRECTGEYLLLSVSPLLSSSIFFSVLSQGPGSLCFLSILLCGQPGRQRPQFCKLSFFFLIITRSDSLVEIRWSIFVFIIIIIYYYYHYYYFTPCEVLTSFHRSFSASYSLQLSRTRLSILDDISNTVVWRVSILMISNFSIPGRQALGIVSRAPTSVGITVTFIIYWFLILCL